MLEYSCACRMRQGKDGMSEREVDFKGSCVSLQHYCHHSTYKGCVFHLNTAGFSDVCIICITCFNCTPFKGTCRNVPFREITSSKNTGNCAEA